MPYIDGIYKSYSQLDLDFADEWKQTHTLIQRMVKLREQKRLGVIHDSKCVAGSWEDPLGAMNPHGNLQYFSTKKMLALCTELESNPDLFWLDAENGPSVQRKPVKSQIPTKSLAKSA